MQAEYGLARVQDALVIAEEARRKVEAKVASLEVEQTSLLLEVGATKDEVSTLQSQAGKEKGAMEEDYQKALELIFTYGYECCMSKHNICGDQLEVPDGLPIPLTLFHQIFFVNLRCPPVPTATEATTA